jgi:hypothetical protein
MLNKLNACLVLTSLHGHHCKVGDTLNMKKIVYMRKKLEKLQNETFKNLKMTLNQGSTSLNYYTKRK